MRLGTAAGFALAAFAILAGLGTWQLQRRAWKAELIAARSAALAADPVALTEGMPAPYARVAARGRFLHDRAFWLANRTLASTGAQPARTGFHLVTPLALEGGGTLLVNRGFVPLDRREVRRPEGTVAVRGLVLPPAEPGRFTPANDPASGQWFWADLPAMIEALGMPARPFIVAADAEDPAGPEPWPRGGQVRADLPNDHLQYALTWYALAVVLAVIFSLYARGRLRHESSR